LSETFQTIKLSTKQESNMNPIVWAEMAQATVVLINQLRANQPAGTAEVPLTPDEQMAVDTANGAMNEAVSDWDTSDSGLNSDTPPE
jgi:hypothetical protein